MIDGDPSIYLTFAKTFFETPFSFGKDLSISFGATSPITLLVFSIFYKIIPDLNNFLYLLKFLWLCSFIASIYFLYKCSALFIEENELSKSTIISILVFFIFLFPNLLNQTIFLLETPLVLLLISLSLYLFFKKRNLECSLTLSLFYLLRPELALLQLIIFVFLFLNEKKLIKKVLYIILQPLPAFGYHFYMFLNTGLIIPTSISSRFSRLSHSETSIVMDYYWHIFNNPTFFPILVLFIISLAILVYKNKEILMEKNFVTLLIFSSPSFMFLIPGQPSRYFDFIIPALCLVFFTTVLFFYKKKTFIYNLINFETDIQIILKGSFLLFLSLCFVFLPFFVYQEFSDSKPFKLLIAIFPILVISLFFLIFKIIKQSRYIICSAIPILLLIFTFISNPYTYDSNLENRLQKNLSIAIDSISQEDDVLAIYEIQVAYHLNQKVLSLDGIVGRGEFLPFYTGNEELEDTIKKNKVTLIGVDDMSMAKPMKNSQLYSLLHKSDDVLNIGDVLIFKDLKFTKVLSNEEPPGLNMWQSIYRISENDKK